MGKRFIVFIGLSPVVHKQNYTWSYFHNAPKIISETLCIKWERQCADGELLQVQQHSVCNIKKHNVIEMTLCVHTLNGVIRINF